MLAVGLQRRSRRSRRGASIRSRRASAASAWPCRPPPCRSSRTRRCRGRPGRCPTAGTVDPVRAWCRARRRRAGRARWWCRCRTRRCRPRARSRRRQRSAIRACGEVAAGRRGVDHRDADALADQPAGPGDGAPRPLASAVLAPRRGTGRGRRADRRRRTGARRARRMCRRPAPRCGAAARAGRCRAGGELVEGGLDREDRPGSGRSRGRRRTARCWCRRRPRRRACSGRRRRDSDSPQPWNITPARGCRRRRCRTAPRAAARSACRRRRPPPCTSIRNGWRVVAAVNCSLAGELELHRAPQAQRGERDDVLDEHLLLAAEAAADPAGDHPHPVPGQVEEAAERARVRNGTWLEVRTHSRPSSSIQAIARVRLQRGVLHPLDLEGPRGRSRRRRQAGVDVAELGVQLGDDVAVAAGDARLGALVGVQRAARRAPSRPRGRTRPPAPRSRRRARGRRRPPRAVRDDRGDPLPDEAHHVVEDAGVVRVVGDVLVAARSRTARPARPRGSSTSSTPGIGQRGAWRRWTATRAWACGERRSFTCSRPGGGDVERVARGAGDDRRPGGRRHAPRRRRRPAPRPPPRVRRRARRPRSPGSPCSGRGCPSGRGRSARCSSVRVAAVMIMPAVQKPHWKPWAARKARWTGCSAVSRRRARRRW